MDRVSQYQAVQKEAIELFQRKNQDYGDAFANYGPVGVIVRMGDKINRLSSVTKNQVSLVKKINKEKTKLTDLQTKLTALINEKNTLEGSIKKKQKSLDTINKTINSTQAAHQKIVEASHVLLTIIKKDTRNVKEN